MTQKIYHLLVVVLFLLGAYGWGRLARRLLDRRVLRFHSLTAIVGLAVLGFMGGLLNLFHLAKTPVWWFLLVIGLGVAVRYLSLQRPWRRRTFPLESIPMFVAPVFALGAALLLMPASVFNFHDDFNLYVTRAIRMAQTGSLAGTAFDCLGLDSLGSSSFFHGFFLGAGGIEFLNGFDAVACFALCLLLIAELSLRWRLPWWLGLCAVFGLTWINPQCVNISPLYSGAAGVMALIVCGMFLARTLMNGHRVSVWRIAFTVGLLAAWLATMKITLAFFSAIFLVVLFVLVGAAATNRARAFKSGLSIALIIFIGALPWVVVATPALVKARNAASGLLASAALADKYPSMVAHGSPLLFMPIRLFYGDTPIHYLALSGVALALAVAGLAHWMRRRNEIRLTAMPAVAAAGVGMIVILFLNSHLFPISMAIRYSCPVLIGGLFIIGLGFLRSRTAVTAPARRWLGMGFAVATASLMALFHGTLMGRLDKAIRDHTLLAFYYDRDYVAYCRDMLAKEQAAYHRELQSKMPAGATAFVWTATPFHFDFERNSLVTAYLGGISNPALKFPAGLPPEKLEQYFRNNGVQFIVLETKGYGVMELADLAQMQRSHQPIDKKFAEFAAYLRVSLDELAARGRIIFKDERMLVFELGGGSRPGNPGDSATRVSSL